jgi:hypothetical protein
MSIPPFIYFGGCAFAAPFYAGVYKSMESRWGPRFHENCIFLGDSAGAIFAVGIALGKTPDTLNSIYKSFSLLTDGSSNNDSKSYSICKNMEDSIRQMIGDDDLAYSRVSNRCFIGTTLFFCRHVWKSTFQTNEDLISTLLQSCRIPMYCSHLHSSYSYSSYLHVNVDGAYSLTESNFPDVDNTLFIRVDDSIADITCSTRRFEAFWPIIGDRYEDLFQQGERVMAMWDGCTKPKQKKPHYGILFMLWVLHVVEFGYYAVENRLVNRMNGYLRKSILSDISR